MSGDSFSDVKKTREFIEKFIGEHGDLALTTLMVDVYKEVSGIKFVIGTMILKNRQREAIDEEKSEVIMQLLDEIKNLSARIAELEQTEDKVLH